MTWTPVPRLPASKRSRRASPGGARASGKPLPPAGSGAEPTAPSAAFASAACRPAGPDPRRRALLAGLGALLAGGPAIAAAAGGDPPAVARAAALRAGSARPLLVVATGNDPADARRFEQWLGRPVDGVQLHNGSAGWEDWSGSVGWLIDVWSRQPRRIFWSIQLLPEGATLAEGAAGAYDPHYAAAARALAASQPAGPIFVRTGWEFNGDWMAWAAAGRAEEFVATFRALVAQFRAVSDRFVFEWSPNVGDFGMDPAAAWPGGDVVDIVGVDFYYQPAWDSHDPGAAWDDMLNRPYGLRWHRDFAAAQGKPRAFSEWGVALDSAGPYVRRAAEWFREDDVVYQSYWNSDADFAGKLSDGRMPAAGAAYREMFAQPRP